MPEGLPEQFKRPYGRVKHFLVVPLAFRGKVGHMMSLARFGDRPFSQSDLDVVQALSATAVLSVTTPA